MALLSAGVFQYVSSTGPATKIYTLVLFLLSAVYFYLWNTIDLGSTPYVPYLTVVPGLSIWYPWTFLTATFVEIKILELLFSLIFIPPSLRYFERLWGVKETLKFLAVVAVASNFIAFLINWLESFVTGYTETFLFRQTYYGQMAIQAAVLVAYTQIIPEHQLVLFGSNLKLRVKRLPMIYVTFSTIMCLLGEQTPYLLVQLGWLVSWTYLRFYKRTPSETAGGVDTYGDRSETFAFIYWFPPFLHTPVGWLSNGVHRLASRLHLVGAWNTSGNDLESGYAQVPGGARAEAERRRALALKVLDQRLASTAAVANGGNPTNANQGSLPATSNTDDSSKPQPRQASWPPSGAAVGSSSSPPPPQVERDTTEAKESSS